MNPHQPLPSLPPHIGPMVEDRTRRARFTGHELAIVLSHYDLGLIEQVRICPLGSRKAPKLIIRSARGEYFLKRRAPGRDDPKRVSFTHTLMCRLADRHYPVPALIRTRDDGSTVLRLENRVYELFEYVHGIRYDKSPHETAQAGAALGRLDRLLRDFRPPSPFPRGTFHAATGVDATFAQVVAAVLEADRVVVRDELIGLVQFLRDAYHDAARRVEECGYGQWPTTVLHGDWHPGNLLFRERSVVGVLDFDSARQEPRAADLANGALQFSIRMANPLEPLGWPEGLDADQISAFLRGYDSAAGEPSRPEERRALPWLIVEALIVESIIPIAASGTFGGIPGLQFLTMVRNKVRWIRPRVRQLVNHLAPCRERS